jgi:hypothetical protein
MTICIVTLSLMTISITTFNIKGLFGTLSVDDTQHKDTVNMLSVMAPILEEAAK